MQCGDYAALDNEEYIKTIKPQENYDTPFYNRIEIR